MNAIEWPYRPDGWEKVIYPMPSFATVSATDVGRSSAWYQEVLGFADVFSLRAQNGLVMLAHLRWCVYGDLLLVSRRDAVDGARGVGMTLNFATNDVDAVAERIRSCGAAIHEGPVARPWNARELVVLDPDGYRVSFTAPLRGESESFDAVMGKVRDRVAG